MSNAYQFKNIQDMIQAVYGGNFNPQAGVSKADAPVLTTTSGFFNGVYGAEVFNQLNTEANVFALLPKYPWQHSGFRVITAAPGSAADGRVAENATIPFTTKPTVVEVDITVGEVVHTFDVSMRQQGLVQRGDDAVGDMEFLRGYFGAIHAQRINEQLLADFDTTITTGFESIDRVTMSGADEATLGDAGDGDIYDIDRGAATWDDAVVDHNSGTDRFVAADLIEDTLATLRDNGARTNLIITGFDTLYRIYSLYNNQVRYAGVLSREAMVQIGINGVQTDQGGNFGVRVATVYGIPIFGSQGVTKDTISRIYLLDTTEQAGTGIPRLGIAMLFPTLYFESGMSAADQNPFGIDRLGTQGMYYTAGELVCTFFAAQGSIRDLK